MSCKQWEESIYIYEELPAKGQEGVDIHLQQCAECQLLFENAQQLRGITKRASGYRAAIKDPFLLTNKIMKKISSSSEVKSVNVITALMDSLFTRYALVIVSLLLVFFFMNEQQRPMKTIKQSGVAYASRAIVPLHSSAFIKAMVRESAKPNGVSLYRCIKSNQCDYAIVKKYKQKKES